MDPDASLLIGHAKAIRDAFLHDIIELFEPNRTSIVLGRFPSGVLIVAGVLVVVLTMSATHLQFPPAPWGGTWTKGRVAYPDKRTECGLTGTGKRDRMWADRHSLHQLRPSVQADHLKLEESARNTLKLHKYLEREFFGFKVQAGVVVPDQTEYWSVKDGESMVFIRGYSHV